MDIIVEQQASHRNFRWQGRQGSNPRPMVLETIALPAELHPYVKSYST